MKIYNSREENKPENPLTCQVFDINDLLWPSPKPYDIGILTKEEIKFINFPQIYKVLKMLSPRYAWLQSSTVFPLCHGASFSASHLLRQTHRGSCQLELPTGMDCTPLLMGPLSLTITEVSHFKGLQLDLSLPTIPIQSHLMSPPQLLPNTSPHYFKPILNFPLWSKQPWHDPALLHFLPTSPLATAAPPKESEEGTPHSFPIYKLHLGLHRQPLFCPHQEQFQPIAYNPQL